MAKAVRIQRAAFFLNIILKHIYISIAVFFLILSVLNFVQLVLNI
jgi:hypothetical protein